MVEPDPRFTGERTDILGLKVNPVSYQFAGDACLKWVHEGTSRFVCVANVHMAMEGWDDLGLQSLFNSADLVVPDGMPLVWALKVLGKKHATRVRGPDLMLELSRVCAERGISIGLYGGTRESLEKVQEFLLKRFRGLRISCAISPPFRAITDEENRKFVETINKCGARVVFVGIGCPKQEKWMAKNRGQVNAVMFGVGAAFDLFSGKTRHAPSWMQSLGLEWFFRLISEPRRLWKRYLKHNPRFLFFFFLQWMHLVFDTARRAKMDR